MVWDGFSLPPLPSVEKNRKADTGLGRGGHNLAWTEFSVGSQRSPSRKHSSSWPQKALLPQASPYQDFQLFYSSAFRDLRIETGLRWVKMLMLCCWKAWACGKGPMGDLQTPTQAAVGGSWPAHTSSRARESEDTCAHPMRTHRLWWLNPVLTTGLISTNAQKIW